MTSMNRFPIPLAKSYKRLREYQEEQLIPCDWPLKQREKIVRINEREENERLPSHHREEYHCQVYLKFFPSTFKCSIEVIVKPSHEKLIEDLDSILIAQTRIPKQIEAGVIRVRLVSSLFNADLDVQEDPSLIKLQTIQQHSHLNHFDKQFALLLKKHQIGPGTIGKLFVESLDPSTGSYSSHPPIFELNLNLASEQHIVFTSPHQKNNTDVDCSLACGCILSSDQSRTMIHEQCNLPLNNPKLLHRLSEPLRCSWKSIGRELFPCFNENDLNDFHQRYFLSEGNHECTYQLLREWYIRAPQQATIRYLLTRLKLPLHLLITIHNDILQAFSS